MGTSRYIEFSRFERRTLLDCSVTLLSNPSLSRGNDVARVFFRALIKRSVTSERKRDTAMTERHYSAMMLNGGDYSELHSMVKYNWLLVITVAAVSFQ